MFRRLRNRITFEVERFILYRTLHQIFFIAIVIAVITLVGGTVLWMATEEKNYLESLWWAFLRLTDPGYLGDDVGGVKRTISTILTILGYVVFLGALVAVMTQALNRSMNRLQRGQTPIAQNDHVLILGWTNRTPIMVKQLLLSRRRVRNYLRRRDASRLQIVILAEEVTPEIMFDLRSFVGNFWQARVVTIRSGTPLRIEHLERVDFRHAGVIILPGGEFGEDVLAYPDGRTVKTLLSMAGTTEKLPLMVAEIRDYRKGEIARSAYGGPIETLETDLFLARLVSQIVRVPGLSHIYYELLTHEEGNELYLRKYSALVGRPIADLQDLFPGAILLGLYRDDARRFWPLPSVYDDTLRKSDRLVLVAPGAAADDLLDIDRRVTTERVEIAPSDGPLPGGEPVRSDGKPYRVLLLGWNASTPPLLATLDRSEPPYSITSMALISEEDRLVRLRRRGVEITRSEVTWISGEFTSAPELETAEPWHYDTIVILASEWLETASESDARTVLGYRIIESILEGHEERPHILAQLMNEANAPLFPEDRCETITGPVVLSHVLAQIALQRNLRGLVDELFGPTGAEIFFRPLDAYGLEPGSHTFEDLRRAALAQGEIAIGLRRIDQLEINGGIVLNPDRTLPIPCRSGDEIVVMVDR